MQPRARHHQLAGTVHLTTDATTSGPAQTGRGTLPAAPVAVTRSRQVGMDLKAMDARITGMAPNTPATSSVRHQALRPVGTDPMRKVIPTKGAGQPGLAPSRSPVMVFRL